MKNFFKYTFAALFGAVALASCTNEYEYDAAPSDSMGGNGYIEASEAGTKFMFVPGEEQTVTFVVGRINSDAAGSVALTSDNAKLTVPASVEFAAGESTKTVTAVANVEVGGNEKIKVSVADSDAFLYARNDVTFTIQVFPVIDVQYVFGFTVGPDAYPWQLYDLGNGTYRVPKDGGYDYDIDFTINSKNEIIVKPQAAWIHQTYGDVYVMGNANGDAKANGTGSGFAGMYDPETGIAKMALYHFVPGVGSFATVEDIIIFPVAE